MRRATTRALWLAVSLLATPALAEPRTGEKLALKVGEKVDYSPGFLPAQVVCDDVSIVSVDAGQEWFVVTGKKAGSTLCGFIAYTQAGRRRVVSIVVK